MSIILENAFTKISVLPRIPSCVHAQSSPRTWTHHHRSLATKSRENKHDNELLGIKKRLCTIADRLHQRSYSSIGTERPLISGVAKRLCRGVDDGVARLRFRSGAALAQSAIQGAVAPASAIGLNARHSSTTSLARLSPQVVTGILRRNEVSVSQGLGPSVARYDCNQVCWIEGSKLLEGVSL